MRIEKNYVVEHNCTFSNPKEYAECVLDAASASAGERTFFGRLCPAPALSSAYVSNSYSVTITDGQITVQDRVQPNGFYASKTEIDDFMKCLETGHAERIGENLLGVIGGFSVKIFGAAMVISTPYAVGALGMLVVAGGYLLVAAGVLLLVSYASDLGDSIRRAFF